MNRPPASPPAMIKIGKVHSNLMVNMPVTNKKLADRALRLIMQATGVTWEVSEEYLNKADNSIKDAIMMAFLH